MTFTDATGPQDEDFKNLLEFCPSGTDALDDPERAMAVLKKADAIINRQIDPKKMVLPPSFFTTTLFHPTPEVPQEIVSNFLQVAMDIFAHRKIDDDDKMVANTALRCAYGLLRGHEQKADDEILKKMVYVGLLVKGQTGYSVIAKDFLRNLHDTAPEHDPLRARIFEAIKANCRGMTDENAAFKGARTFARKLDSSYVLSEENMKTSSAAPIEEKRFKKKRILNNRREFNF